MIIYAYVLTSPRLMSNPV